jgi:probable rRNA maturation factor
MPSEQPEILFTNRQSIAADVGALTSLAQTTLQGEGVRDAELSVSLVTIEEMSGLHQQYLDETGPTDVLSFPMDEATDEPRTGAGPAERPLLGDVVICPEYAARNNPDVESELRVLLVHGILHLLGYDHQEEGERVEMWARQERYSGVTTEPGQEAG